MPGDSRQQPQPGCVLRAARYGGAVITRGNARAAGAWRLEGANGHAPSWPIAACRPGMLEGQRLQRLQGLRGSRCGLSVVDGVTDTPDIKPPPPTGTIRASRLAAWSRNSRPTWREHGKAHGTAQHAREHTRARDTAGGWPRRHRIRRGRKTARGTPRASPGPAGCRAAEGRSAEGSGDAQGGAGGWVPYDPKWEERAQTCARGARFTQPTVPWPAMTCGWL